MNEINVGTLFSGIGAFEEALTQLHIPHKNVFACDNGEIELIPLEDIKERKEFKDYQRRVRSLSDSEKIRHKELKDKIARKIDEFRQTCWELKDAEQRAQFIAEVYRKYEGEQTNWMKVTYMANHQISAAHFHTDVRFLKGSDYAGQIDILVGGSPCQSFSTYGKKQGLEDARGTLFYDYARIIKETQPKIFIYENVASLKTHDHKRTWKTMLQVWESLGYTLVCDVLNAADYNHPQLRKRLFLIGFRKDIYTHPYVFPAKKELKHKSTEYLETEVVPNHYYLGKKGFEWITTVEKNKRRSRVNQDVIGCQTANQQDNWIGDFRVERPTAQHWADNRIWKGQYVFDEKIGLEFAVGRKMTPRECLNLMGFNRDFKIPVSDNIAYRQAGNSIVVPVLKEIIKSISSYFENNAEIATENRF